jgi:hypothetical protein
VQCAVKQSDLTIIRFSEMRNAMKIAKNTYANGSNGLWRRVNNIWSMMEAIEITKYILYAAYMFVAIMIKKIVLFLLVLMAVCYMAALIIEWRKRR